VLFRQLSKFEKNRQGPQRILGTHKRGKFGTSTGMSFKAFYKCAAKKIALGNFSPKKNGLVSDSSLRICLINSMNKVVIKADTKKEQEKTGRYEDRNHRSVNFQEISCFFVFFQAAPATGQLRSQFRYYAAQRGRNSTPFQVHAKRTRLDGNCFLKDMTGKTFSVSEYANKLKQT
jgi:hypothetical protein